MEGSKNKKMILAVAGTLLKVKLAMSAEHTIENGK